MISIEIQQCLARLGRRLKQSRLDRDESQARLAARIGVSTPTLRKMENGDPAVQVGTWATALFILDRLEDFDRVLKKQENLFEKWEKKEKKTRKRASKRGIKDD